jgi:hypothetical protein
MTPRKQITMQRRAKQAAKKHSAERKNSGKQASGAKARTDSVGVMRGVKLTSPSKSQLVEIEKPIYGGAL